LKHYVLSSRFILLSADVRSGGWGSYGAGLAAVRVAAEAALEMGVAVRSAKGGKQWLEFLSLVLPGGDERSVWWPAGLFFDRG